MKSSKHGIQAAEVTTTSTQLKTSFCWLSCDSGTGNWLLGTGHLPLPSDTWPHLPCSRTLGAKSTKMLDGHRPFSSQAPTLLHVSPPPFFRLQAQNVPVNKGEVLCYNTPDYYNPRQCRWQWCSCCSPSWMQ